mgnify:CR=1 FL=1
MVSWMVVAVISGDTSVRPYRMTTSGTCISLATRFMSCTGHGESFIRAVAAHDVHALMDYKGLSLAEAVRRLTGLPAANLGLERRGLLKGGYFADVVVFDPQTIADKATFELPHQLAVGMQHVFVNGAHVLKDGAHTGAKSGRALWGPGKTK